MTGSRQNGPSETLTISEAAQLLEVSEATLRRWDASGKFPARRHPVNDYRMYPRREVERLKREILRGVKRPR